MTLDQQRVEELFYAAMKLASAEREPFLDKECAGNDSLRGEVESLLEHHFPSAQTVRSSDLLKNSDRIEAARSAPITIGPPAMEVDGAIADLGDHTIE